MIRRVSSVSIVINRNFCVHSKKKPQGIYDVVVIGGGHNGLISAAYLAKAGKRVCLLERRPILGGAAVTEEIVPGFKFSRASYVLGLLRPHIYSDLNLAKHGLRVHIRNPSSYTPIHESQWGISFKAKSLTLGNDANFNHAEISKFSTKDATMYPKYEAVLHKFVDSLTPLLDRKPPQVSDFYNASLLGKLKILPQFKTLLNSVNNLGVDTSRFLQIMTAPTTKILNEWFESEPLKATLATDSVIGAMISPNSPGSGYVLLHHVMAQVDGNKGCWGNPIGGMGAVTQAIAKSAAESGVEMHVNEPVKEILLDSNNRACGVKTENGAEITAKWILSNATPKVTFLDLLPQGSLPEHFEKEIRSIDYTSPVCKINVALKEIPNFKADPNSSRNQVMPHHQCTVHLNCERMDFIEEAYQDSLNGQIPKRPMIELTLPSSCDSTISPKGAHVALFFTQYVPYEFRDGKQWDDITKKAYAEKIFAVVDDYAPGFKDSVIDYEVLPPPDLEKIFGLTGGNIFHGAMSLDQLFISRPTPSQYSVGGLLICGAGAHPGGGVMGSPGYLAAQEVLKS